MKLQKINAPTAATEDAQNGSNWVYDEPLPILPLGQLERVKFFKTHDIHPERGEYWGDGVPRDFGGNVYEPINWGHTLIFGRR